MEYVFEEENFIAPDAKAKPYSSLKASIKDKIVSGKRPARAAFEVEQELGGLGSIANKSALPCRSLAC